MNIQTVIANLLQTIERKEQMLTVLVDTVVESPARREDLEIVSQVLVDTIKELNAILADCMAVREADIVKDLEMKELKRQNSDYSWMVNPDRMGQ